MPASLASALGMLALAVSTVFTGCHVSLQVGANAEDRFVDLDWVQILMLPVGSSVMLLLLFYYFWLLQYALLIVLFLGSFSSVFDVTRLFCARCHSANLQSVLSPRQSALCALFSGVVMFFWLIQGNFLAHDIIGCCLSISFISMLRFPSLRLASLCLALLFFYDLFWVFFSEGIFKSNVMVAVATKQAASPVHQLGVHLGISALQSASTKVDLPLKLLLPAGDGSGSVTILGLGDITMPGILCCLALRCDQSEDGDPKENLTDFVEAPMSVPAIAPSISQSYSQSSSGERRLFSFALGGYTVGLSAAFLCSGIWRQAQPALIYIVPGIIGPLCIRAYYEGRLAQLWNGPKEKRDY